MYRVYVMIGDILDHSIHQRHAVSTALLCQTHKALLQMALDGGAWDSARLLWPAPPETEVNEAAEFGGSEHEMRHIQQYRKAVADLKAKTRSTYEGTGGGDTEEQAPANEAGYKKKKKGNGKGGKAPEQ